MRDKKNLRFSKNPAAALMQSFGDGCGNCAAVSLTFPPFLTSGTNKIIRQSGIKGFLVMKNSAAFATGATTQADWAALIASGDLRGRIDGCTIRGTKGESEQKTQRLGSCADEYVVSTTQTFTITDSQGDDDYELNNFYIWLNANWKCLNFAIVTCDDELIGYNPTTKNFTPMTGFAADEPIAEFYDSEPINFKSVVKVKNLPISKPVKVSFIDTLALNG